jgi:hypothetical protein
MPLALTDNAQRVLVRVQASVDIALQVIIVLVIVSPINALKEVTNLMKG